MTDRLTPTMRAEIFDMIANAANEASDTDHNPLAALGKSAEHLRDEAARHEAEAPMVIDQTSGRLPMPRQDPIPSIEEVRAWKSDAPPPPAPDDLVRGLRDRARHARAEGNATATSDAWHFEQAADAIEALRVEREQLRTHRDQWRKSYENVCQWHAEAIKRAEAAEADAKRLREALDFYACVDHYPDGCAPDVVRMDKGAKARAALAGGNDDQGK